MKMEPNSYIDKIVFAVQNKMINSVTPEIGCRVLENQSIFLLLRIVFAKLKGLVIQLLPTSYCLQSA